MGFSLSDKFQAVGSGHARGLFCYPEKLNVTLYNPRMWRGISIWLEFGHTVKCMEGTLLCSLFSIYGYLAQSTVLTILQW